MPIDAAETGVLQAIQILAYINLSKPKLLILDEPDAHPRFKSFTDEDLIKRDKVSLDIFWLKDEALEDSANLPAPEVIAADIVEDLQAALAQFARSQRI